MTNAQLHVDAFVQAFGEPPVWLPNLQCRVLSAAADGGTLVVHIEDGEERYLWRYANPPVMVPDPMGTESDGSRDDDENLIPMRTDPLAIATVELAKQLTRWRG
jgi:hypothetical protein